jgi:hypothetical protein
LLNIGGEPKLGIRVPVGDGVEEIIIEEGCFFPSYANVSKSSDVDVRYLVAKQVRFTYDEEIKSFVPQVVVEYDFKMAFGASVKPFTKTTAKVRSTVVTESGDKDNKE